MQERWVGKDVDLKILCRKIDEFLVGKGFKVRQSESAEGVELIGIVQKPEIERVRVSVGGSSGDFVVGFESPVQNDFSGISTQFLTFFGLGFLVYKKVKKYDYYQRLEEGFWALLSEAISDLTNSVSRASGESG